MPRSISPSRRLPESPRSRGAWSAIGCTLPSRNPSCWSRRRDWTRIAHCICARSRLDTARYCQLYPVSGYMLGDSVKSAPHRLASSGCRSFYGYVCRDVAQCPAEQRTASLWLVPVFSCAARLRSAVAHVCNPALTDSKPFNETKRPLFLRRRCSTFSPACWSAWPNPTNTGTKRGDDTLVPRSRTFHFI